MTIVARREGHTLILEMGYHTNSFTLEFLQLIDTWLKQAENDRSLRAIILSSTSKVFSVGGDLDLMMTGVEKGTPSEYVEMIVPKVNELILNMVRHPVPIITVINGAAAGGGMSLFLAGDYRITGNKGKFVTAFANLALTPDSGTSVLFSERRGKSVLLDLITSKKFDAKELVDNGFAHELVDDETLLERAKEIASELTQYDRWTISQTKKLVNSQLVKRLTEILPVELNYITLSCKRPQFEQRLRDMVS